MGNQGKELYEFGPFRLDPVKRLLLRDSQPVPLQLKAFETLLVLVRNHEQVVSKDELMRALWPDTFVEESNLAQNVFVLRKALGDAAGEHRYIITIPGRGYSFAGKVRVITEEESLMVESRSRTRVVIDEKEDVSQPAAAGEKAASGMRRKAVLGTAIVALAVAAVVFRPTVPPPKVIRIHQITRIGTLVHNTKLLTDGPRIYFRMWEGKERVVRYVSPEGGDVFPVDKAFPEMDIDDLSASGSEFLVVNLGDLSGLSISKEPYPSVWRVPVPSGSPRPVGEMRAHEATWSPDGRTIACAIGSDLYLANPDGGNARKFGTLPGEIFYLAWSPDSERVRFSVADPRSNGVALWEADLGSKTVRPLLPDWPSSGRAYPGGWTRDGRYFFFTALGDGTRNIWAIRDKNEILRRINPQPVQITAGPLTFYLPTASKDGKSVFVIGEQLRGELVRYDAATGQFVPYAQGISADHVAFSGDGQWMAYVEYPESVLVRSRADGSDRRQLTFSPMRASDPQWSPDGTQIAFQATAQMGANDKIYLVSSNGGVPILAGPERSDRQTYPSWASDGGSILFSSSDETESNAVLDLLDLKTKGVSQLPCSTNLYWGQVSPDGRHVVALEKTAQNLTLYDMVSHKTQAVAGPADYPRWSADGQYVYFSTLYFRTRGTGGVYRWKVTTNTTENVVRYPDFRLAGVWGVSYGLTPDGAPLLLRDLSTRDLYALDVELP